MKPKLLLGLALVLSGAFTFLLSIPSECRGDGPKLVHNDKKSGVDDVRTTVVKIAGLNEPLAFTEQPTLFTVQMGVTSYRDDEKHTDPKVNELHRQAWLLLADGTSIPQSQKPDLVGIRSGGYTDLSLIFIFQKKSTNEVAGIVVSINGELYCRETQTNSVESTNLARGDIGESLTEKVADSLTDCQKIKPGMTRADLLKTFTIQGGFFSATHRTFVYRRCHYIKIDVEFKLSGPGQNVPMPEEQPTDVIRQVSKPYLDWGVSD